MIHDDGTIVASEVYEVGDLLGFTVHQIRLVFARIVADGLFTQHGRGRAAVLNATSRHELFHGPEVGWLQLAYDQDRGRAPWDRMWHLVSFSIEEDRREARNEFRRILLGMGGGAIAGGLYVQALDWTDEVRAAAKQLDMEDNIVIATTGTLEVGNSTNPIELAQRLWPISDIATAYDNFVRRYSTTEGMPAMSARSKKNSPIAQLASSIEMSTEFESCIRQDPLLPPELLPQPWPGTQARQVLRDRSAQIVQARRQTGHLALFATYDRLFDALEK